LNSLAKTNMGRYLTWQRISATVHTESS